jgi:cholesterol transport system auxiliary component
MGEKWIRRLTAAGFAVLVSACAQPLVPEDHYYRLEVTVAQALGKPPLGGTVEVERLAADGLTAGRPIVYSDAARPFEAKEYHYHFWTDPPGVMVQDQVVNYLRGAGLAERVVTPAVRIEPDFQLTGRVVRLEQIRGNAPKGVAEIEFRLRAMAGDRLLLLETYRAEVAARSDAVADAIVAINAALEQVLERFAGDLARL